MGMEIPDIKSVLYDYSLLGGPSAGGSPERGGFAETGAQMLVRGDLLAKQERWEKVKPILDQLEVLRMRPIEWMCERYLRGRYEEWLEDWSAAYSRYEEGLHITHERGDLESEVVLACSAGDALHDLQEFKRARKYFAKAYSTWLDSVAALPTKPVEPQVRLLFLLSRACWLDGDSEGAQQQLALAVTLAENVPEALRSPTLNLNFANCLWMLALIFHCESDALDGDSTRLENARERLTQALRLYAKAGVPDHNFGRCYVRMAEASYDIAEHHLSEGKYKEARLERAQGKRYAIHALKFFPFSRDKPGRLLPQLTLIRHHTMWRPAYARPEKQHAIERALHKIEQAYASANDSVGMGKAATVRAEWMLLLNQYERAQECLTLAFSHFERTGIGEATRAQRLQRLLNHLRKHSDVVDPPRTSYDPDSGDFLN